MSLHLAASNGLKMIASCFQWFENDCIHWRKT